MLPSIREWRLKVLVALAICQVSWMPASASDDGPQIDEKADASASDGGAVAQDAGDAIELLNPGIVQSDVYMSNSLFTGNRLWVFSESQSGIGVSVAPLSNALRTQLGLTDDRGVVVTNVEPESPADQAGIRLHDVLLSAGGEPVDEESSLQERIDAAGGEAVPVIVMRSGERMALEVTPNSPDSVWVGSVGASFWIGITAAAADEALRAQLGLAEGQGLVVTEVYDGSAADEAGIEVHDVLLQFEGTALSTVEELNSQIQEVGNNAAALRLIRGGDELTLKITPRAREAGDDLFWVYDTSHSALQDLDLLYRNYSDAVSSYADLLTITPEYAGQSETETVEQKMQGLIEEARALTERMRALQESLQESNDDDAEAASPPKSEDAAQSEPD